MATAAKNPTAKKAAKPAAKRATRSAEARAPFDIDALKAERQEAIDIALNQAADITTLKDAVQRVLTANVRLKMHRADVHVFKSFAMKFENKSHSGDSYARLDIAMLFDPSVANAPYMSDSDLFEGLPVGKIWSGNGFGHSAHKSDKEQHAWIEFKYDRDRKPSEPHFVMFELTIDQMRSANTAWESTRKVLMQQEEQRLRRENTGEAAVIEELNKLTQKESDLEEQLNELREEISEKRAKVEKIRSDIKTKVSKSIKAPPVLAHLNSVRAQLGMDPA